MLKWQTVKYNDTQSSKNALVQSSQSDRRSRKREHVRDNRDKERESLPHKHNRVN